MLLSRIDAIERHLRSFVQKRFDVELERLAVEAPPRVDLGDAAFPFPFELAKILRRPPRDIAAEVVEHLPPLDPVARFSAAGAGYVNAFFKRESFARDLYRWLHDPFPPAAGDKVIVEHTNINPNKAAHIGHLRNAALGDTLVRLLRARGRRAEVQNYIDNTGVQVADVVVGFEQLRRMTLKDVEQIHDPPFDFYCWDLYAEVSEWYARDESRLEFRQQALQAIESGEGPSADLAQHISARIVLAHLQTMLRIGVRYQVLPRESEILHLRFWEEAFAELKHRGAILRREEGPNAGCWVMLLEDTAEGPEEKIIVRSNGTVTYVGKDIAYQLWKFGLLGKDFHFQPFGRYRKGRVVPAAGNSKGPEIVWCSSTEPGAGGAPEFGRGSEVYNVIDVRQSYLQQVVVEGLRRLGFNEQADRSVHFSYEMVALSPACCEELGIPLSEEERQRPHVEVSGRKGLGVKADELIDKLIENSLSEVRARQESLPEQKQREIATQIAVSALRYFLLKYTRNAVIAFDFSEALAFEGETGPYLQYSVVRANNIFRKLAESDPGWDWTETRDSAWRDSRLWSQMLEDDEVWSLLLSAARLDETIDQCLRTLEMSTLARHAFVLAQQFNLFYHRHHILSEKDPVRRALLLTVADTVRQGLVRMLDLLGIEIPDRM